MDRVRVKHNVQVTIPKEIRDKLGIEEGASLDMTAQDGTIVLKPLPRLEGGESVGEEEFRKILAELDELRRR